MHTAIAPASLSSPSACMVRMSRHVARLRRDATLRASRPPVVRVPWCVPVQLEMEKAFSRLEALRRTRLAAHSLPPLAEGVLRERDGCLPALALIGELDPRKSDVDALAGLMPNLKLVLIPAADHMTAFRNPEFLKSLKAFLGEHFTK